MAKKKDSVRIYWHYFCIISISNLRRFANGFSYNMLHAAILRNLSSLEEDRDFKSFLGMPTGISPERRHCVEREDQKVERRLAVWAGIDSQE